MSREHDCPMDVERKGGRHVPSAHSKADSREGLREGTPCRDGPVVLPGPSPGLALELMWKQ